uniref:ORF2 n=1 Tax=Bemisia tabaci negevirus 1 TaxID=2840074 RepID=A0A8E8FTR4_9VIRU|nr:ORF2 [Bemisia tabaci negevirus 1]
MVLMQWVITLIVLNTITCQIPFRRFVKSNSYYSKSLAKHVENNCGLEPVPHHKPIMQFDLDCQRAIAHTIFQQAKCMLPVGCIKAEQYEYKNDWFDSDVTLCMGYRSVSTRGLRFFKFTHTHKWEKYDLQKFDLDTCDFHMPNHSTVTFTYDVENNFYMIRDADGRYGLISKMCLGPRTQKHTYDKEKVCFNEAGRGVLDCSIHMYESFYDLLYQSNMVLRIKNVDTTVYYDCAPAGEVDSRQHDYYYGEWSTYGYVILYYSHHKLNSGTSPFYLREFPPEQVNTVSNCLQVHQVSLNPFNYVMFGISHLLTEIKDYIAHALSSLVSAIQNYSYELFHSYTKAMKYLLNELLLEILSIINFYFTEILVPILGPSNIEDFLNCLLALPIFYLLTTKFVFSCLLCFLLYIILLLY